MLHSQPIVLTYTLEIIDNKNVRAFVDMENFTLFGGIFSELTGKFSLYSAEIRIISKSSSLRKRICIIPHRLVSIQS